MDDGDLCAGCCCSEVFLLYLTDAKVRAKMLQASSRAGLLKALGANNFKHDWFATSIVRAVLVLIAEMKNDLTPSALTAHLNHLASPPPLSASEAALAEVREAEAAEAKRAALDPEAEARRKKAIVGLGGKFKWEEGVAGSLQKCSERSDDGWIVCLVSLLTTGVADGRKSPLLALAQCPCSSRNNVHLQNSRRNYHPNPHATPSTPIPHHLALHQSRRQPLSLLPHPGTPFKPQKAEPVLSPLHGRPKWSQRKLQTAQ